MNGSPFKLARPALENRPRSVVQSAVADRGPEGKRSGLHPYQSRLGLRRSIGPGHRDRLRPERTHSADMTTPPPLGPHSKTPPALRAASSNRAAAFRCASTANSSKNRSRVNRGGELAERDAPVLPNTRGTSVCTTQKGAHSSWHEPGFTPMFQQRSLHPSAGRGAQLHPEGSGCRFGSVIANCPSHVCSTAIHSTCRQRLKSPDHAPTVRRARSWERGAASSSPSRCVNQ